MFVLLVGLCVKTIRFSFSKLDLQAKYHRKKKKKKGGCFKKCNACLYKHYIF